jgi:hypothetical protein
MFRRRAAGAMRLARRRICSGRHDQPSRDPDLAQHFAPGATMHWIVASIAGIVLMWLACRITHWWLTRGVWNRDKPGET